MIKVPAMVTVYDLVAKGQLSLDDPLALLTIDKVGGSGVLQLLHNGLSHTKVHHKVSTRASSVAPDSTKKYGLGVTTPNKMTRLFELLARGQAVDRGTRYGHCDAPRRTVA